MDIHDHVSWCLYTCISVGYTYAWVMGDEYILFLFLTVLQVVGT